MLIIAARGYGNLIMTRPHPQPVSQSAVCSAYPREAAVPKHGNAHPWHQMQNSTSLGRLVLIKPGCQGTR